MLHIFNGFLAAAIGFSMTIGVIREFFEFGMDLFFGLDMQEETILLVNSLIPQVLTEKDFNMRLEELELKEERGTAKKENEKV